MPKNNQQICLTSDQLTALVSIASVMPVNRRAVLLAILTYLQPNTLKSTATRKEIVHQTGLSLGTIRACINEFEACGLIRQWRGPFEVKQKFYKIILPVSQSVFEFYGKPDATKKKQGMTAKPVEVKQIIDDQPCLQEPLCKNTVSEANTGNLVTVGEDAQGAFCQNSSDPPSADPREPDIRKLPHSRLRRQRTLQSPREPLSYQELAQDIASDISDNCKTLTGL